MIEGGAAEESVGNQHFWLLLSETHEFCHCGANTRAAAADADAATRARDKGPKWKFVGDKKSLVIGLLRGSASDSETLRENASITIHITGSVDKERTSDGVESVSWSAAEKLIVKVIGW